MSTYPLTQLLQLRQSNVRQLEQKLVSELAAVNDAEMRVADLETRRALLQSSAAAEQRRQFSRALQESLPAQDFMQGAAHQTQQRCELERLQQSKTVAMTELEGRIAITRTTEQLLVKARRQLAAVERHQQRFLARRSRLHEARLEEDADEVWQAVRTAQRSEGGK